MEQSHSVDTSARHKTAMRAYEMVRHRLGKLFDLFDDPNVTEVKVNSSTDVFVVRAGRSERVDAGALFLTGPALDQALSEIASSVAQDVDSSGSKALVYARMPGYRVTGCLFPFSSAGTSLRIRKHSSRVLSLEDYFKQGLPEAAGEALQRLVAQGTNILISGGTDTGKTTFLNMISRLIPDDESVLSIEDTRELTLKVQDWVAFEYNVQAGVTAVDMLQLALRYSPKRIILGELRDTVAAAFLEAMNTGHEGCMATLHANGTEEALTRIETLCLRSSSGWPLGAIQNMIRSTVGAVVQLANVDGCRQVVEIVKVHPRGELKSGQAYSIEPIYRLGSVSNF